jgi:hypothetical protein
MVLDASASSQHSLLKFLSRSRKKRTISIDSTMTSISESLDYSTTSSTGELRQRRHIITSSPVVSSHQGVYARATSYIRRRNVTSPSASSNHTMEVIEDDGSDCESALLDLRVEDLFCKTLNECEPSQLEQLRRNRAEVAPIVCYESDDDDNEVVKEHQDAVKSLALKSRLEALEVQQRLLGKDHPDVVFMTQQLRRLQRRGNTDTASCVRRSHFQK